MTQNPEKTYLCTDCRRRFATKGARKQHWQTTKCQHGHGAKIDSDHPVAVKAREQDFREWVANASPEARRDVLNSIASDLPDGAYLEMAESEFNLGPDDLGE